MSVTVRSGISDGAVQYNGADMISVNTGNVNVTSSANLNVAKSAAITGNLTVTGSGSFAGNLTLAGNQVLTTINGGLGYGQTWQNETSLRGLQTSFDGNISRVYTNSTSKPILVSVTVDSTAAQSVSLCVGSVIANKHATNANSTTAMVTGIIPINANYQVVYSSGTLSNWAELR